MNILVIGLILLQILIRAACQDFQCVNHPALDGLQRIVLQQKNYDEQLFEKLSTQLTILEDRVASSASSGDLGMCSQYNGQKSCCDSQLVSLLQDLAFSKYKELKEQKSFYAQVLSNIGYSIKKCGGKNEEQEEYLNDLESSDSGIKEVEILKSKYKQCMILSIKSVVRYYRGQVCAICADGDGQDFNYFTGSTNQYVLDTSNFNLYAQDMIDSITCMDSLRQTLPHIVNLLFDQLSDSSASCNLIRQAYSNMLTDNLNFPCQGVSCQDNCSNVYFLDTQKNCEVNSFVTDNIQDQVQEILDQGYFSHSSQSIQDQDQSSSSSTNRYLLNIKKSNFFLSDGGIKSYIVDEQQDEEVTIKGAVYLMSTILQYSMQLLCLLFLQLHFIY